MPGFGGGLSYCAHLVRWGARTTPLGTTDVQLPPNDASALALISECRERKIRPAPIAAEPFARA
jgi:3-oxoacyl-[acyl-carrier-protein] synthase-3